MLYHLLVLLQAAGVPFEEVKAELERRTGETGLQEKARGGAADGSGDARQPFALPRLLHRGMGEAPRRHADDAGAPKRSTRSARSATRSRLREVEQVYLPVSRLLSFYVTATHGLFHATQHFLGTSDTKVPFIIGIGGSVAVGKSTTARVLRSY